MNEKIFKSAGNQGHWKQSIALEKHLRVLELVNEVQENEPQS